MKVAVSSQGETENSPFSSRFGRCACFMVFDTEEENWTTIDNPGKGSRGGAGTAAVQGLAGQDVDVVISGRFGPHAFRAFSSAGMKPIILDGQTPQDVVGKFLSGEGDEPTSPSGKGFRHRGRSS